MIYLSTLRSLLRDFQRTKTSTPNEIQLKRLRVETHEDNEQYGLGNIEFIREFLMDEKRRAETQCMKLMLLTSNSARYHSEYVSSLLVGWITWLSKQVAGEVHITRNHKLCIENDTYSTGITSQMTMSFPHPFLSIIIRERHWPEASISSAELYLMLALAETCCTLHVAQDISIRVLIVYSSWVQIVTVKTTPAYITSIVKGWKDIEDKMEIHHSSWFNFLDAAGQLRILLYSFGDIRLGLKKTAEVRTSAGHETIG